MSTKYKKLFEPLSVGKLSIKNRIAMAPLGMVAIPHLIKDAIAPSEQENRWDTAIQHRATTVDEIKELIASFVTCAVVAKESKFDGVEIHAAHEGYLLD